MTDKERVYNNILNLIENERKEAFDSMTDKSNSKEEKTFCYNKYEMLRDIKNSIEARKTEILNKEIY